MSTTFLESLAEQTEALKSEGLFKSERLIAGPQQAAIDVRSNGETDHVLNLCANNYLGLANHPEVIAAAHKALEKYGYGMASVRFICGTQTIHKELEARISSFLGTEDTILYPSCFDANGGLFETLLGPEDAVVSDALNHASIIDGVRLCKARRFRYAHMDMADLEAKLVEAADARVRLVATDGVWETANKADERTERCCGCTTSASTATLAAEKSALEKAANNLVVAELPTVTSSFGRIDVSLLSRELN